MMNLESMDKTIEQQEEEIDRLREIENNLRGGQQNKNSAQTPLTGGTAARRNQLGKKKLARAASEHNFVPKPALNADVAEPKKQGLLFKQKSFF